MGNIQKDHTLQYNFIFNLFLICQLMAEYTNTWLSLVLADTELWPLERPNGMPNIIALEVMCGKDHMDVHLTFSHPFEGIVSSKGQHSDPHCVYIPPATSKTFFTFRISYSRCGTKPDLNGHFYENTVVVQYDKDLLEVWDEAKRLRCEWFNDYEKTASKPPMVIADLDVVQLDFRGDNVDCWMEIQHGKGPWAPPVNGIVPLGSTLTLVVAINDYRGEFDMRVKSCIASDGSGHVINLSDEQGCVLRPKMISRFLKARAPDDRSTAITYAFFHAFKFPDALSVHIKCKVEICRHGCLDHCQLNENINDRKDDIINDEMANQNKMVSDISKDDLGEGRISAMTAFGSAEYHKKSTTGQTNDIRKVNHENLLNQFNSLREKDDNLPPRPVHEDLEETDMEDIFRNLELGDFDGAQYLELRKSNKFPYGPRQMAQKRMGIPIAGPRSLNTKIKHEQLRQAFSLESGPFKDKAGDTNENTNKSHKSSTQRRRRSIIITDRKVRSTDVGVSSIYDVISEADLAFSLDVKQEAVTIFQGKISEEVVYGICLPVQGFSMLFIVVVSFTIVAALVAGSMLYRYQLQKEAIKKQVPVRGTLASWMTLRLFRLPETQYNTQNTQKSTTLTTLQNSLAGLTIPASLSEESVLK